MAKCPHCKKDFEADDMNFSPFTGEMGDPSDYGVYSCPNCEMFLPIGEN